MLIQIHGQSELDWGSFLGKKNPKQKTLVFKVSILCVCEGRVVVCVGGSVGVLMRFVWRSLGVGMGCVGGVGGWVSEFWTSGIVYMLICTLSMSTVCLPHFNQKVDWVSFGKTLFNCSHNFHLNIHSSKLFYHYTCSHVCSVDRWISSLDV